MRALPVLRLLLVAASRWSWRGLVVVVLALGFGGGGCKPPAKSTPLATPKPPVLLEEGVSAQIFAEGDGAVAKAGDKILVHYTGTLADGTKFDSSVDRDKPFSFRLGQGHVIKGWDVGVLGMREGEKRRLVIPPAAGYGSSGTEGIPANSELRFEIQLLKIY